jgi:dTDP-4-amino-4,6-dideoxygalactose transaminase
MAVTNDADLAKAMRLFRSHGVTRDTATFVQKSDGPWSYEQQVLGFNYRMTDLQAALGLSQMERLDLFVAKRQALAGRYATLLEGLPLSLQEHAYESVSAFHLMVVRLHLEEMRISRSELVAGLQARNISTNVHYKAVHTQPYYQSLGFSDGDFPTAERYAKQTLSLPLYPTLTEWEQDHVAQALKVLLTS